MLIQEGAILVDDNAHPLRTSFVPCHHRRSIAERAHTVCYRLHEGSVFIDLIKLSRHPNKGGSLRLDKRDLFASGLSFLAIVEWVERPSRRLQGFATKPEIHGAIRNTALEIKSVAQPDARKYSLCGSSNQRHLHQHINPTISFQLSR